MKPPPKRGPRLFQPSRLRVARMAARMTRAKLHEATGFTMAAIADYERGFEHPDANQLRKLAEALGVSVRWFYRPHLECPDLRAISTPRRSYYGEENLVTAQVRAMCAIGMDLAAVLGQQRRERADNTFEELLYSVRFCESIDAAYVVRAQIPTVGGRRIRSVVHMCELLNILVLAIPPQLLDAPTDPERRWRSWSSWLSGHSPVIFVDTSHGDLATREAIATELLFLLKHLGGGSCDWPGAVGEGEDFASNLLFPVPDALGEKGLNARSVTAESIRKVATRWGVSPLTIVNQIRGPGRWKQGVSVRLDKAEAELRAADIDDPGPLEDIDETSKLLATAARNGWPLRRIADGIGLPTTLLRDLTRGLVLADVVTMTELRQAANRRRGY